MVYRAKNYAYLDELKIIISAECNEISVYQLANVRGEFYERPGQCQTADKGIFDPVPSTLKNN